MNICILCLNEYEKLSGEHIVPDSIGGDLEIGCLCKGCNSKLGDKVDERLTNNQLVSTLRVMFKIRGKSGSIPNPLEKITLFPKSKNFKGKGGFILDKNGNYKGFRFQEERIQNSEDSFTIVVDASEPDKAVKMINKKLERLNQKPFSEDYIKENLKHINFPPIHNITMSLNLNELFTYISPALIKIAYEMTFYWLGERYLKDEIANDIREFLYNLITIKDYHLSATIPTNISIYNIEDSQPCNEHKVALICKDSELICDINLFNVIGAKILVSENTACSSKGILHQRIFPEKNKPFRYELK